MRLFTNFYTEEILACDEIYLVNDTIHYQNRDEVSAIYPKLNATKELLEGNVIKFTVPVKNHYRYRQIILCNSKDNNIYARIDCESLEDIECKSLTIKITITELNVTSTVGLNWEESTPNPGIYGINKISDFRNSLSYQVKPETINAYANNYAVKNGVLYEVPLIYFEAAEDITNILPINSKGFTKFLFIETLNYKYLIDFDNKVIFSTNQIPEFNHSEYTKIISINNKPIISIYQSYIETEEAMYDAYIQDNYSTWRVIKGVSDLIKSNKNIIYTSLDSKDRDLIIYNSNEDFEKLTGFRISDIETYIHTLGYDNTRIEREYLINGSYLRVFTYKNESYLYVRVSLSSINIVRKITSNLVFVPYSNDKLILNTSESPNSFADGKVVNNSEGLLINLFGRDYIILNNLLVLK